MFLINPQSTAQRWPQIGGAVLVWLYRKTFLPILHALTNLVPLTLGSAGVFCAFETWNGVRLMGGLMPGRALFVCAAVAIGLVLWRHARVSPSTERRRDLGWRGNWVVARALSFIRLFIVGGLIGELLLRSLHPVRADTVYVVLEAADPVNDAAFRKELLDTAVKIVKDHKAGKVEIVGSPRLDEYVRQAGAGRLDPNSPEWWEELKQQASLNQRLDTLERHLKDRIGESVHVISVNPETGRARPWPIAPDRMGCFWHCVDPSQAPRSDRTQLVSYSIGQDAAVAPYLYVTVRVKSGDPAPKLKISLTAEPLQTIEPEGRFGDYYGYHVSLPRHKAIESIEFEGNAVPLGALQNLKLAKRQLKVKFIGPESVRAPLRTLPMLDNKEGSPVVFVDSDPDVIWHYGKMTGPPEAPTLELLPPTTSYRTARKGFQLRSTSAYQKSGLGGVALPTAGSEFRDLNSPSQADKAADVLVSLGDGQANSPLLWRRDPKTKPHWASIVLPQPQEFDQMTGNVPRVTSVLLIWATSLVYRSAQSNPEYPMSEWQMEQSEGIGARPAGPETKLGNVFEQVLRGLNGELDGNTHLDVANSLREECSLAAWLALAFLLLLAGSAAVFEVFMVAKR